MRILCLAAFQGALVGLASGRACEAAGASDARVVITEVMYNPASDESAGEAEWVEIANLGSAPIEISGWRLDDEDTRSIDDWGPFSCTLAPGAVAVLVNEAAVDEAQFREAWEASSEEQASGSTVSGTPRYQVIPVKWGGISNNPTDTNEVLQLLDSEGKVVCEVNLRNGDGWPKLTIAGGPSIHLTDLSAANVNDGALWKASEAGRNGARECRRTAVFNGKDIGSPGVLPRAVQPAPTPETASPGAASAEGTASS